MGWPYAFITLNDEETELRRVALDHYASIAHYSAFAPAVIYLLYGLGCRVLRRRQGDYQEVPNSPAVKASKLSYAADKARQWRVFTWWLGDDVYFMGNHWGHRDEWVFGLAWTAWLLVLCVRGTGNDYLHLTKRFGIIAASQMPIQYLMALKKLNPFAYVFRSSHEQVNRFHRILGRIIYFLLISHATFYNIFFFESGIWLKRFFTPIVFAGVVAFTILHTLNGTSMASMREWSYRVFFVTHLISAMAIPPLIYFHAPSARPYVVAALLVFVFDLATRKLTTVTALTTVEAIPGTNLLKLSASLPAKIFEKYRANPGSHIYLSIPPSSRPIGPSAMSAQVFDFLYNPFTVSSINEESGELNVVARTRSGPMTSRLAQFAANSTTDNKVPLCIEGPYGAAGKTFSELVSSGVSRILLVAGGVGATFAVPIYHAILQENPTARVQLVWAIRSAGDATWATSGPTGRSVMNDDQVHLFLTGDMGVSNNRDNAAGVEMSTLSRGRHAVAQNKRRPNFEKIIDDAFRHGSDEKVAILVCGPAEMGRQLRRCVTPWVEKGRKVWWHNESFGW
ncbi:Fc.00g018160.m01.CDS01 [Cosmosporella sp. VM-42]